MAVPEVKYEVCAVIADRDMEDLRVAAWPGSQPQQFADVLDRSLAYVSAYVDDKMIGFVNLAWDGGEHSFLLDTLVHPEFRHRGIGTELVKKAIEESRSRRVKWVHVDFEPHLTDFYRNCGFRHTEAGLVQTDLV